MTPSTPVGIPVNMHPAVDVSPGRAESTDPEPGPPTQSPVDVATTLFKQEVIKSINMDYANGFETYENEKQKDNEPTCHHRHNALAY